MSLPVSPYKVERRWVRSGLECAVAMAYEAGHRCGYVRVPPGHPLHGKKYESAAVRRLRVHGGVNYAAPDPSAEADGVGWWFGFDCARASDLAIDPKYLEEGADLGGLLESTRLRVDFEKKLRQWTGRDYRDDRYRAEDEVALETDSLADQLAAMGRIARVTLPNA